MDGIAGFFDYIGRTNLFNFFIFVAIFALIFAKADLGGMLEKAKSAIIERIEESKKIKSDSESNLKEIEDTLSHIGDEVDELIKKSEENAKNVGEKILSDAKTVVAGIKNNSEKNVANKAVLLKNDILKRAALASIEVAKNHIVNELNNNYDLHQKLIEESINAIDSVEG